MPVNYHIPLMPGKAYHLFNRAIGNEKLFRTRENYFYFLQKYALHTKEICDTYCYCLLPNHFHLMIRIKQEQCLIQHYNLVKNKNIEIYNDVLIADFIMERFSNWLNGYTKAINKVYKRKGALFMDYTRRKEIEDDKSFGNTIRYIHKNPEHHSIVSDFEQWEYSSYHSILSNAPTLLLRDEVLRWFGNKDQFIKFHH